MGKGFYSTKNKAKVCSMFACDVVAHYHATLMHRPAQAALSSLAYEKIRAGQTDQPHGFFLAREATKYKAGKVFHIIVSDGKPHNYGIKSTCGKSGFVVHPGASLPNSPFCVKACASGRADDCDECKCALMVANEFNARSNFDTYTVSILDFKDGNQNTGLAFESAKFIMQVCQLYTTR